MKLAIASVLLLALAGCAATGPGIGHGQVTELQRGKTTYNDVVRRFGSPSLNSKNMDGTRTAIYLQPGNDEPGAVVSLVTVVAGTRLATRESVTFEFDEKNVLTDYHWTRAAPAQAPSPAAAAQPYPASSAAQPAAQPAATVAAQPGTAATPRPAPAPAKKRNDSLPGWLPNGNYDPRDPFK